MKKCLFVALILSLFAIASAQTTITSSAGGSTVSTSSDGTTTIDSSAGGGTVSTTVGD